LTDFWKKIGPTDFSNFYENRPVFIFNHEHARHRSVHFSHGWWFSFLAPQLLRCPEPVYQSNFWADGGDRGPIETSLIHALLAGCRKRLDSGSAIHCGELLAWLGLPERQRSDYSRPSSKTNHLFGGNWTYSLLRPRLDWFRPAPTSLMRVLLWLLLTRTMVHGDK
jgi:hypothetical protein